MRLRLPAALLCALPVVVSVACATEPATSTTSTGNEPLVGVDGSTDTADRACNVILRTLERANPGTGYVTAADGSWVYMGTIEISEAAAADGHAPAIMWIGTDGAWQVATGTELDDGTATPGYVKYSVTIDHDAPGPATDGSVAMTVADELPMTGGGRLFDHNRNPGDFDNYSVASPDYAIWDAQGTCKSPSSSDGATIDFHADFTQTKTGVLSPGGTLDLHYDPARLSTCAETQGGRLEYGITAWAKFDSGELLSADVLSADAVFTVPTDGAQSVAIWFESNNVDGCHVYDSNFGANYVFAVATPPRWLGNAATLLTRDSDAQCSGGADAVTGFSFDTWARERAVVTNLCFQVYQPGETDPVSSTTWQDLDATLHWRLGAGTTTTAWFESPIALASQGQDQVGNNAQYAFSWRDVDPFRDFHCPEVTPVPDPSGQYVEIQVEYWIDVNGGEVWAEGDNIPFVGNFLDYPTNPWRTANCN